MCTWEYNISKPWKGTKLNWRGGMEGKPTWKWKCFQFGSKPKRSGDLEIWMDLGIWVGAELLIPSEHCGPSDPARWKAQRTRWVAGVAPSNECCFAASKRRDCARAGSGQIKLDLGPPIRFDYISAWRSPTRRQTSISSKSIALLLSSVMAGKSGARTRKRVEATDSAVLKRARDGSAFTRWSVRFLFLWFPPFICISNTIQTWEWVGFGLQRGLRQERLRGPHRHAQLQPRRQDPHQPRLLLISLSLCLPTNLRFSSSSSSYDLCLQRLRWWSRPWRWQRARRRAARTTTTMARGPKRASAHPLPFSSSCK